MVPLCEPFAGKIQSATAFDGLEAKCAAGGDF